MLLGIAIFAMIAALTCYTSGVWGEKLAGILKNSHLIFFWIGLFFDTLGTTVMGRIAGVFTFNMHGVTGLAAIVLMCAHAVWATHAVLLKRENILKGFHRFSLVVWGLWLVPFASGMFLAMAR